MKRKGALCFGSDGAVQIPVSTVAGPPPARQHVQSPGMLIELTLGRT